MASKAYDGPYVSRGGEKLRGALDAFQLDVTGVRAIDVGASTGGFTDCLLQAGAAQVTALDVAYGQLAWTLRQDPRVIVRERTNYRTVDLIEIGAPFSLVVADLSFIGLTRLLERFRRTVTDDGNVLLLVKPQFEADRASVPTGGVIRDAGVHRTVLRGLGAAARASGLAIAGWTYSPIRGAKGNIEFWLHATGPKGAAGRAAASATGACGTIEDVVAAAHKELR
ncbi:MAG: TlyA family RNA methyltransferase [Actinomycetes bacterium]|jgi:23S rRNA (cytidine1920-2'-O)/16S rRNA (cytidine1409-2'-O)-methyltransferase|nr:TlyA family RNA methyltransferase [Actinomycetes bacterium]